MQRVFGVLSLLVTAKWKIMENDILASFIFRFVVVVVVVLKSTTCKDHASSSFSLTPAFPMVSLHTAV